MRRIIFTCLNILIASQVFFHYCFAEDPETGKKPPKSYHVYEDVRLVPTTKFFYYKPKITAKAVFPLLESETEDENINQFNELISKIIKEEVDRFRQQVKESLPDLQGFPASDIKNEMNIDFNTSVVNGDGSPTMSIRFSIESYIAGMAHPYQYHRTVTYDLYNGQQIELAELFTPDINYLQTLADYVKPELNKRLKYKQIIHEGMDPTEENYKNWNINPYGILITFDAGQVAPRVQGTQTVLVPYSAIKSILAKDTPVSACLKHRKKCMRDTLLTGGFIEEATLKPKRGGLFHG